MLESFRLSLSGRRYINIKQSSTPLCSWLVTNQRSPDLGWKSEQKVAVKSTRPSFFPSEYKRKNSGMATRDYAFTAIAIVTDNLFAKYLLVIFVLCLCAHCFNMPSARTKRARAKQWYTSNKEDACAAHRKYYATNAEKCKEASKLAYENKKDSYKNAYVNDPEKFKEASKKAYANDPEKFKEASKKASKKAYASNPEKFKEASKKAYANNPEKFKEASKKASKKAYADHPEKYNKASKRLMPKIQKSLKRLQGKLMLVTLTDLKGLQNLVTILILKRKGKHQKRPTEKTQKSVNRPLKTTIMSTEKKCVLRKESSMYCGHLMKPL